MTFSIELVNFDKAKDAIQKLPREAKQKLSLVVERNTAQANADIQQSFSGAKTGRRYRVPFTNRTYRASAAGETPAIVTGNLKNNMGFEFNRDRTQGSIFNRAKYAHELELGVNRIAPRPFLKPWADANKQRVKEEMTQAINEAIRSAGLA